MIENSVFDTVAVYYSDSTDEWATWSAPVEISTPFLTSHGTTTRQPAASRCAVTAEPRPPVPPVISVVRIIVGRLGHGKSQSRGGFRQVGSAPPQLCV